MKCCALVIAIALTTAAPGYGVRLPESPVTAPQRPAAEIYRRHCSSCHGVDGHAKTVKAKFNHARNIADPAWQNEVSDERIFNSIMNGRNGRGNMPAFNKKISEQEADALVKYVRSLKS